MPLSPQQKRFLHTHNHPKVRGVKQQQAAAYVARLNDRIQALQEQQVARDHRAALREQRNFLTGIASFLILQHISLKQAKKN